MCLFVLRHLVSFPFSLFQPVFFVGSPEKPLSDLGALSYKSYWASTLLVVLKKNLGEEKCGCNEETGRDGGMERERERERGTERVGEGGRVNEKMCEGGRKCVCG